MSLYGDLSWSSKQGVEYIPIGPEIVTFNTKGQHPVTVKARLFWLKIKPNELAIPLSDPVVRTGIGYQVPSGTAEFQVDDRDVTKCSEHCYLLQIRVAGRLRTTR